MPRIANRRITKRSIIERLKKGVTPERLKGAQRIGEGCFRIAYAVGDYVVKHSDEAHHRASTAQRRIKALRLPIKVAPTTYVKTRRECYVVQPRVRMEPTYEGRCKMYQTRLSDVERNIIHDNALDLHYNNIGLDSRGNLVAFDWIWVFALLLPGIL